MYDEIEKQLKNNKVKYVSVTAASNVTGYVTDVHRVAKLAHKYGAKIIVDGAQIVAHRKFSMMGESEDENIDFFVFSAHKMYAPYGGGAVVGLTDELMSHMPKFYGGGTIHIVGDEWVEYAEAPKSYEAGSPNYPGVVAMGKAIDILEEIGFDKIEEHEKALNQRLVDGLLKIDNAIVYGDAEDLSDRVGVITFNFSDVNSYLVAEQLSKNYGIATRRGAFCANPYVWRLYGLSDEEVRNFAECSDVNTPGMIRVSFGIYNTEEEVDYLLKVLPKAIKQAKKENKENFNLAEPKY
jgi:selenocysteine lyase/cysteine desulfurase